MNVADHIKKGRLHRLLPLAAVAIFGAALWALHREMTHFNFADFRAYLGGLSKHQLSFALAAMVGGYCALICYDWFALKYIGQKLDRWRVALTAFVGFAFSMNIGHSVISGGAVRMRLYSSWGIGAGDITRVIGFNFVMGIMGQCLAGGLLFTVGDFSLPATLALPFHQMRWVGVVLLVVVGAFLLMTTLRKEAIEFRSWRFELPSLNVAGPAIVVATFDWLLAGVVLFYLMPEGVGLGMWHFLGIVLLAQFIGLLSMVPGGLGVFETAMIHLLPESVPGSAALSALIAYRAIYYLLPLLLAIFLLGSYEMASRSKDVTAVSQRVGGWIAPVMPVLLSVMVFVAGAVLLVSGATPAMAVRLASIEKWLPLSVLELSHFLGSIVGVVLLLLAFGLRRRVDAAWWASSVLLIAGIIASLLKGLDYEEAALLFLVLIVLLVSRRRFNRHASLFSLRFSSGWWVAIAMVLATVTWIGFTTHQRTHYSPELWAHFGFKGDASRFLRASAGVAVALGGFAIWHLLRPSARLADLSQLSEATAKVLPVVQGSNDTNSYLALLGDKRFIFSESGRSFIMYGVQGRTWIAMGDVIGEAEEAEDLVWKFRELCDAVGARSAFYQVSAEGAHIYAGVGLLLYKLGEEALVDLSNFSLEGSARKNLRYTKKKIEHQGVSFEMVSRTCFQDLKAELRAISDDWLADKNAAEKGFSLGSFREDYLQHFDFAVVKLNGRIVAFSNICAGAHKQELSVDLMRHTSDAPYGAMEYLFIELMLWGKAEGYRWFSLGMAPLSGLENRTLAPVWNRIGAQIFSLGEHFYNFQGLRTYKEKFDPEWKPRYLACRGILQLPVVLLDIASLIGGGIVKSVAGQSEKPADQASHSSE